MNNEINEKILTTAERAYETIKRNLKNFRKAQPEKMAESCKKYMITIKKDPERLIIHLEKRKNYYYNVVVPRKKLLQQRNQQ